MAVATNKRRYEEIEECNTLHVIGIRADPTFLRSEEFKAIYLRSQCGCCGSENHALLGIKAQLQTRSGKVQYEYQCPVADYEDINTIDRKRPENEINISYWLDSTKYAMECQFSPTMAKKKFKELGRSVTADYETVMQRFQDQVLEICQDNRSYKFEQKRQRKEMLQKEKELLFQDTFLTTPCRICGTEDHKVLKQTRGGYEYEGPSALAGTYQMVKNSPLGHRLQICPEKFAAYCGYNPLEVNKRMESVSRQQKYRMGERLTDFQKAALTLCKWNSDTSSPANTRRDSFITNRG